MTVHFDGEEKTLQQMGVYLENTDRELRQQAWELVSARRLEDRLEAGHHAFGLSRDIRSDNVTADRIERNDTRREHKRACLDGLGVWPDRSRRLFCSDNGLRGIHPVSFHIEEELGALASACTETILATMRRYPRIFPFLRIVSPRSCSSF